MEYNEGSTSAESEYSVTEPLIINLSGKFIVESFEDIFSWYFL